MADSQYIDYFSVDPLKLDWELEQQPLNYYKVAKDVADAARDVDVQEVAVDVAKEEVKRVDADLRLEMMRAPELFNLPKTTEAVVDAAIINHPDHAAAFKAYTQALLSLSDLEHHLGVCKAALGAMDNKKQSLGKGVELQLANYRSTPRVRDDGTFPATGRRE